VPELRVGTKIPESVLVVIYTSDLKVLLLERADRPGFWQSVTGSKDALDELARATSIREVQEETGLDAARFDLRDWGYSNRYEIFAHWRHRYPEGVTHNTEYVFGLKLPEIEAITIAPREHLRYEWLDWSEAAQRCFSPTNAAAIRKLPCGFA
jgi:dihydroneopterin triphosphate diphosphatase